MTRLYRLLFPVVILLICDPKWTKSFKVKNENTERKYRFKAEIHKFEFRNGTESVDDLPKKYIRISRDAINNPATVNITETIRRTATINDIVVFQLPEPFTKMESAAGEPDLQFSYEGVIRGVSETDVQERIGRLYQVSQLSSLKEQNITVVSQGQLFGGILDLVLPPCSVCVVDCIVKKVKDFPVLYTAYANVSAVQGTPSLSAEELRNNLPEGMKYIRDVDQHTVEVSVEGKMFVEFELGGITEVNCNKNLSSNCRIPDNSTVPSTEYHQTHQVPIRMVTPNTFRVTSPRSNIFSFLKSTFELLINYFN